MPFVSTFQNLLNLSNKLRFEFQIKGFKVRVQSQTRQTWINKINPPASEASREVANLPKKNPHTLVNGVKEFVCLSVTKFINRISVGGKQHHELMKNKSTATAGLLLRSNFKHGKAKKCILLTKIDWNFFKAKPHVSN